jgi:hypothetical protein
MGQNLYFTAQGPLAELKADGRDHHQSSQQAVRAPVALVSRHLFVYRFEVHRAHDVLARAASSSPAKAC